MNINADRPEFTQKSLLEMLEEARRRLVETGTRNRLIHVNRAAKRANALNIINERSDDIYDILRVNSRKMKFKATGKDKTEDADDLVLFLEDDEPFDEGRYLDSFLETPLGPDALQKRLLRLYSDAKTAEEEQGINILYLAMGFLKWFEDKSSAVQREAPLILIPVALKRNERGSTFDILVRDDDIVTNLPLQERLKGDFGISLPEIDDSEPWSPSEYYQEVYGAIEDRPGWEIDQDGMQLGFFSFAKLLMLHDLEPEKWPGEGITENSLLRSILRDGFEAEDPLFKDGDRLDDKLKPGDIVQVVDADASQTKVIHEVRTGRNLVVQGPPGTGKSQTITNIIASAIHDGKTVLFVAEKMAALEVVHKRLVKAGLKDASLELHSRFANKRSVLEELGRTLNAGINVAETSTDVVALEKIRGQLTEATNLLHSPMSGRTYSAYSAMGEISRFFGLQVPAPSIKLERASELDNNTRDKLADALFEYTETLKQTGSLSQHPFSGVANLELQPTDQQRLEIKLKSILDQFNDLREATRPVSEELHIDIPNTLSEVDWLVELLGFADAAPEQSEDVLDALLPHGTDKRLSEALTAGDEWRKSRNELSAQFTDAAFQAPVAHLRPELAKGVGSFFSRLFGRYRGVSREFATLLSGQLPKAPGERLALLDRLASVQKKRSLLAEDEGYLSQTLGGTYRGERTDFATLSSSFRWLQSICLSNQMPSSATCHALLKRKNKVSDLQVSLKNKCETAVQTASELFDELAYEPLSKNELDSVEIDQLLEVFGSMSKSLSRYSEWVDLSYKSKFLKENGLAELLTAIEEGQFSGATAVNEFKYAVAEARWNHARTAMPQLAEVGRLNRHQHVEMFRTLENKQFIDTAEKIGAQHLAQVPKGAVGQMGFLRAEIAKKRRHKSIRKIIEGAGEMVQRIKPVFLMSPISVAQFLKPGALKFDLLVIDEASQVRPEDAFGAVARADQIVVVGDRKQLPPTSFFDRLADNVADDEDDEDQAPVTSSAVELESILTACEARGLRSAMLEWHYRSRDPSLIQVSNLEFYESRLVLPPSPVQLDNDYGLRFIRVEGEYSTKSKGRGRANTNRIEAEKISDAISAHAHDTPEQSLGVVAFSKAQADMINEVLEVRRREDTELDGFLREGRAEDMFVKNIENVQGDERDVIMISVGYGPHEANGRLASMNFGPVNGEGGGRRLNVLFSRARLRCDVFCSFDPGEIDPRRATRDGPRILKRYLEFAKTGQIEEPENTGLGADSPFEEDVASVICNLGYPVDYQVGSSGFRIDLGVRHPERLGQYLLAVECDGATYHSALWARERDRLRQEILENLGWKFHRIWSTDWFNRRPDEISRLKVALERAVGEAEQGVKFAGANVDGNTITDDLGDKKDSGEQFTGLVESEMVAPKYKKSDLRVWERVEPHEVATWKMADYVCKIVEEEGPIHFDEVVRRIASAYGKTRAGNRIQGAVKKGLDVAYRNSRLRNKDAFWFTAEQQGNPPVRNRSDEASPTTKAEYLSALEVEAAAAQIRDECGDLQEDEFVKAVCRLLGFLRAGPELQTRIRSILF